MDLLVEREDVWAASVDDKPGQLAAKLAALTNAGADLDFIIARRSPEKPGTAVVFVTPLRGDREVRAAATGGFTVTSSLHSIRVEGPNKPGAAAKLAKAVGEAGVNMRGFSAATQGTRFVAHVGVDTAEHVETVIKALTG